MSDAWKGVSRARKCPICQHEDWCGYWTPEDYGGELICCQRDKEKCNMIGSDGQEYVFIGSAKGSGSSIYEERTQYELLRKKKTGMNYSHISKPQKRELKPVDQIVPKNNENCSSIYTYMQNLLILDPAHKAYLHSQLSNGEDEITADIVRSVLGISEKEELVRIIQAMLSGNYADLLDSLNSIAKSGKSLLSLTEELLNESTSLLLAKTGQPSSASAIAENYALERLCELSAKLNWLNDELKNAAGSGIAAYIHATKDLNTGESGLSGKLKSLEDQVSKLSAELMSIKSGRFPKPVDTALEAETNIPITSNSSAQSDLPEESVPVLNTPSKTSEVAQTETTDFDALFGDWGFDSFDNTDEPGFFESAEDAAPPFQETAAVSETSAALSAGELAQKSLSERISNDPVIKEKLLSAEWIIQEEDLLLKVLPEYKEEILLFIAASGIKNITIC